MKAAASSEEAGSERNHEPEDMPSEGCELYHRLPERKLGGGVLVLGVKHRMGPLTCQERPVQAERRVSALGRSLPLRADRAVCDVQRSQFDPHLLFWNSL